MEPELLLDGGEDRRSENQRFANNGFRSRRRFCIRLLSPAQPRLQQNHFAAITAAQWKPWRCQFLRFQWLRRSRFGLALSPAAPARLRFRNQISFEQPAQLVIAFRLCSQPGSILHFGSCESHSIAGEWVTLSDPPFHAATPRHLSASGAPFPALSITARGASRWPLPVLAGRGAAALAADGCRRNPT